MADSGRGMAWNGWVGYLIYMEFYVGDTLTRSNNEISPTGFGKKL